MKYLILLLPLLIAGTTHAGQYPKREFRGAWIQTVFQDEYRQMTPAGMRADFSRKLDFLQARGINAIIFQVRPEADAWYRSRLEPWSRFLTGQQGVAPDPEFDPVEFLARECHERCMEFHAWINPFRAGTAGTSHLAPGHLYERQPGWFVLYNNQLLFDPGRPECRQHLLDVARDIVSRYDVDAIHLDDYFYPYPVAGIPFPDDESFRVHGPANGFSPGQRAEWRRDNINRLVRELKQTIREVKPWVRLGVSPFGIYRNKRDTPDGSGSDTRGTRCYDDLHADVLLWVEKGWVDYIIPQLYWEIGHEAADYVTLARWWSRNARGVHLYIGQDVARAMKAGDLEGKMRVARAFSRVNGNCFWPANEILLDRGGIADSLSRCYHRYPALVPAFRDLSTRRPARIQALATRREKGGYALRWEVKSERREDRLPRFFVIYCFADGEKVDLEDPSKIKAITPYPACFITARERTRPCRIIITAVDHYYNESPGRTIRLDL